VHDDFIDLRSGRLSSESFWPSFTDIMTVVVMIFLLTSVVLMVRNWELIDQLRTSMLAEKKASEMIRSTSEENATLEEQLAQAQHELSVLRMQLMQASENNESLNVELADKERRLIVLLADNQKLQNSLDDSERKVSELGSQLDTVIVDLDKLRSSYEAQSAELKSSRDRIIVLSEEKDTTTNELASLQNEFGSLKVKYDKLIKPARSAKGKYVVEVNYQKVSGTRRIRLKDAGDTDYRTVNTKELHAILAKLKQEHDNNLYIKIIIPEDSGLSYNEAWEFMKGLLDKYDYYN
jgi:chromosome segregation ATPase